MIAPWYTQRDRLTNEPKRTAGQCKKITEWYTNTNSGQGTLSGIRVADIYCKNADGAIVYCRAIDTGIDPNLVSCEGEATCTPFTPSKSSNSVLNCFDDGNGQELAEFSDGNGGHTYLDSSGVYNCLHKYGQLYLDFVDTCNGNYNANVNEATANTIRACAPDTSAGMGHQMMSVLGTAGELRDNYFWDSATADPLYTTDPNTGTVASRGVANWGRERQNGFECYADGHMGNNNCDFFDQSTQRTGLSPNNWGYGRNFISTTPYWTRCEQPFNNNVAAAQYQATCTQPEPPWWAYDDVYDSAPVWAATLTVSEAVSAGYQVVVPTVDSSPSPPGAPPNPPPPPLPPSLPPSSPPSSPPPPSAPAATGATGPVFSFPSTPPPPPPPAWYRRNRLRRLSQVERAEEREEFRKAHVSGRVQHLLTDAQIDTLMDEFVPAFPERTRKRVLELTTAPHPKVGVLRRQRELNAVEGRRLFLNPPNGSKRELR